MKPYYEESGIRIFCGDNREILPELAPIDLILTDPPYGVGIKYGPNYDDGRSGYWEWFVPWVEMAHALSRTMVFTHRNVALKHINGWDWVGVWNKPGSFGARIGNSCVLPHWEPIFMFGIHRTGVKTEYLADVLTFNPNNEGKQQKGIGREKWAADEFTFHPTPKPPGLFNRLLRAFAQNGETVVDPFCGSGVTLMEAKALGIPAVGIDIEERYCEMTANRLRQSVLAFA